MATIEIYIGAPIEHESERVTLARVVEVLSAQGIPAVILANVNLSGRQIDLAIGLDQRILVLECKGLNSPVRGSENGHWHVRLSTGQWKAIPNLYAQALSEKHALRDAMAIFSGVAVPYPDAALVFVPAIPRGSTVPSGDFKVSVGGLDALPDLIASAAESGWSLGQWRAFAIHHRLLFVSSLNAALDQELLQAEWVLKSYCGAFTRTYDPVASAMIPVMCVHDGKMLSSEVVAERAIGDGNVLLTGESGCGKSLLTYKAGLTALGIGCVPIVVPAKDFEGNLRDVLNREVSLLDARSAAAVISAAQRLGRRILLLIDGYNECKPSERGRLTRSIAAAVKRYDACVLVSTRIDLERSDLLPTHDYAVQSPDINIKQEIAQQAADGVSIEAFSDLLDTVASGLEARLIGQLGPQSTVGTSKHGLFDAYVRMRLGSAASDGIRALSRIAGMMTDRISFTLSVRDLDRLMDGEGVSGTLLQTLQAANILDKRGDRVGFSHEMFLNVFAAEAILRRSGDDADEVASALQRPSLLEIKPFVLGAIDDDHFRRRVLSHLSDARVVSACLTGQFGRDARAWANERCDHVLALVRQEIESVRFEVSKDFAWNVQAMQATLHAWTKQDRAVLAAIPRELVEGRRLDEVLGLIGTMDERLAEEHSRLIEEARTQRLGLRSGLYATSYTEFAGHEIGLAQICGPICSGLLYDGPKVAASAQLFERLRSKTLSPGQVGLLVELDKYSTQDVPSIGILLPAILKRLWPKAAHHLRLALMHAAGMSSHALNDDERHDLISTIEGLMPTNNGFDSAGMIDALKFLGALDDEQAEHIRSVKTQIDEALADRNNPLMFEAAAGLWNAQFDHPYDGAYCEAWGNLPDDDRKTLLAMAAQSADHNSMFTPTLIAEVASYGDPAASSSISRWTALPPKREVFMQDAIRTFEMAHAALARLHCRLPDRSTESLLPAEEAFLACGAIIYWLNRDDIPVAERKLKCAEPLSVLSRHELGVAAGVIARFSGSDLLFAESAQRLPGSAPLVTSIAREFPEEITAAFRAALEQPTRQTGYFEFFRIDDVIEEALEILGSFGNNDDLPQLRRWSVHPRHGHKAVRAIKAIEKAFEKKRKIADL